MNVLSHDLKAKIYITIIRGEFTLNSVVCATVVFGRGKWTIVAVLLGEESLVRTCCKTWSPCSKKDNLEMKSDKKLECLAALLLRLALLTAGCRTSWEVWYAWNSSIVFGRVKMKVG